MKLLFIFLAAGLFAAPAMADRKGNAWPVLPDVPPVKDVGCRVTGTTYCQWEPCQETGELIWVCNTETTATDDCVGGD